MGTSGAEVAISIIIARNDWKLSETSPKQPRTATVAEE